MDERHRAGHAVREEGEMQQPFEETLLHVKTRLEALEQAQTAEEFEATVGELIHTGKARGGVEGLFWCRFEEHYKRGAQ